MGVSVLIRVSILCKTKFNRVFECSGGGAFEYCMHDSTTTVSRSCKYDFNQAFEHARIMVGVSVQTKISVLGGVLREQKMLEGHLTRVIYHQVYHYTKINRVFDWSGGGAVPSDIREGRPLQNCNGYMVHPPPQ